MRRPLVLFMAVVLPVLYQKMGWRALMVAGMTGTVRLMERDRTRKRKMNS